MRVEAEHVCAGSNVRSTQTLTYAIRTETSKRITQFTCGLKRYVRPNNGGFIPFLRFNEGGMDSDDAVVLLRLRFVVKAQKFKT